MGNAPLTRAELLEQYNIITDKLSKNEVIIQKCSVLTAKELYKLLGKEYRCEITPINDEHFDNDDRYNNSIKCFVVVYPKFDACCKK